jgi:hypothetical protein
LVPDLFQIHGQIWVAYRFSGVAVSIKLLKFCCVVANFCLLCLYSKLNR